MAVEETGYKHIVLNEEGVPVIAGTSMKVIELVAEHVAWGWSPWELQYQHPYLTLGQVFSALAYYADHRPELDADMERRSREVARLREALADSPVAARLRAIKAGKTA